MIIQRHIDGVLKTILVPEEVKFEGKEYGDYSEMFIEKPHKVELYPQWKIDLELQGKVNFGYGYFGKGAKDD